MFLWNPCVLHTHVAHGASLLKRLAESYVNWQYYSYHLLMVLAHLSVPGIFWEPLVIHSLLCCPISLGACIFEEGRTPVWPWTPFPLVHVKWKKKETQSNNFEMFERTTYIIWDQWLWPDSKVTYPTFIRRGEQGPNRAHSGPHPREHNLWHSSPD